MSYFPTLSLLDGVGGVNKALVNSSHQLSVSVDASVVIGVTGTFWQATQPISAAALPLPSGAATSGLQTSGNTLLSTIATNIPVQGQALAAASMPVVLPAAQITALTPPAAITNYALETGGNLASLVAKDFATQTTLSALNAKVTAVNTGAVVLAAGNAIAGKFGIDQTTPGTTNLVAAGQNGTWNITNISGTISLPTGAATSSNQTNASQKTQIVDGSGNVIAATSNALNTFLTNSSIAVTGTFWQATQPVSGTLTANQGTANATPWNFNLAQFGGSSVTLGQKTMANSIPFTLASDQPSIAVTGSITSIPNLTPFSQSITLTGQANGLLIACPSFTYAEIEVSGAYTGLTLVFVKSMITTGTPADPWFVTQESSSGGSPISSTAISNSSTTLFQANLGGAQQILVYASALTSGSVTIRVNITTDPIVVSPSVQVVNNPLVQGTKTPNNAVPGTNWIAALPAISTAAAPLYVEGFSQALSTDLSGGLRTVSTGNLPQSQSVQNVKPLATYDQTITDGQTTGELLLQILTELKIISHYLFNSPHGAVYYPGDEPQILRNDQSFTAT